jgi:riboflavin synthase
VEGTAELVGIEERAQGLRLRLLRRSFEGLIDGQIVAHNGVALPVEATGEAYYFALVNSRLRRRTTIDRWRVGWRLSVERSATPSSALDGHWLRGQTDALGQVRAIERGEAAAHYFVVVPETDRALLIERGTVAVDGVGLTIAQLQDDGFWIELSGGTLGRTNLSRVESGDWVNLEYDVVAKYVARRLDLEARARRAQGGAP